MKNRYNYIFLVIVLFSVAIQPLRGQQTLQVGPYFLEVTDANLRRLPFLKYDGNGIIDIRHATPRQMENALKYEKLVTIGKEGKWYDAFWSFNNRKASLVAAFENNNDEIYVSEIKGRGFLVNGTAFVEFANVLIDEKNANNYRYHVVKNNREEIVPWKKPDQFIKTKDEKFAYAYLGKFSAKPGDYIQIEIYNTHNYADRSTMFVDWITIEKPQISGSIKYSLKQPNGIFDATVIGENPDYRRFKKPSFDEQKRHHNFIDDLGANYIKLGTTDSLFEMVLQTHNTPALSTFVYLTRQVKDKQAERILIGGRLHKTVTINKELWKTPGNYTIEFVPYAVVKRSTRANKTGMYAHEFNEYTTRFNLTVLPEKTPSIRLGIKTIVFTAVALMILIAATIAFIRYRNLRRLNKAIRSESLAVNQLQSVRSQLNPHFMFNALSGIQTLINKNEIEKANEYLARFSRLTRQVLDDTDKEYISLEAETRLLEDYLQMEQLRFGFQYTLNIDSQLNKDIDIPVMLLQPLVENAVKHGIINKRNEGFIKVSFLKSHNDLILEVTDNGDGFDSNKPASGKGLALTQNRIMLSNTIHKNAPLNLSLKSANTGTTATIILNNWLL